MKILDRVFCISPITLCRIVGSTPNIDLAINRSQIEASKLDYLIFSEKFQGVSEKIWKNRWGQIIKLTPLVFPGLLIELTGKREIEKQ